MKTDQKYYIGKNDKITIRCLACKKNRTIAVADLKLKQHSIKVVCPLLTIKNDEQKKEVFLRIC